MNFWLHPLRHGFACSATAGLVLALAFAPACSDDDAGDPDASGDVADTRDSSDASEGITPVAEPILERTPSGAASCVVDRAVSQIAGADYQIYALDAVGSKAVATSIFPTLKVASAGLDGAFGQGVVLDAQEYVATYPATAYDGSDLAVVWFHGDDFGATGKLKFARLAGADLAVEVQPMDLAVAGSQSMQPDLVARPGGWAVLYSVVEGATNVLRLALLDADGAVQGTPTIVSSGLNENIGFAQSLVATDGGFAATWTNGSYVESEVFFARLDAAGQIVSGPHRISRAKGGGYTSSGAFDTVGTALVAVGDKYVAAFVETYSEGGFDAQKSSTVVRIATVDGDGKGQLHTLQAPVEDMTANAPSLVTYGENIGVLWSYGTIIYICGGCIADYDMHLALLDPATLSPVAPEVVQVSGTNGFRSPRGVVLDGKLFTTTSLDFHALSYPATGVFACTPSTP